MLANMGKVVQFDGTYIKTSTNSEQASWKKSKDEMKAQKLVVSKQVKTNQVKLLFSKFLGLNVWRRYSRFLTISFFLSS